MCLWQINPSIPIHDTLANNSTLSLWWFSVSAVTTDAAASGRRGSEELAACLIVRDNAGQMLSDVYFGHESRRPPCDSLLTRNEERRVAVDFQVIRIPSAVSAFDRSGAADLLLQQ